MSNPLTDEVVARSQLTDDFLFQVVDDPNGTPTARTVSITDAVKSAEISVLDTAGYYTGTNIETVLAELATSAVHNVKNYGATGDGVTDDTAALAAAVTAASGGCLYFPEGVYLTTAALLIPASTTVRGVGQGSTIKASGAVTALINLNFTGNVTVESINFNLNSTAALAIRCAGTYDCLFRDLYISGSATGQGVSISNGSGRNVVTGVRTTGLLYGIIINNTSTDTQVSDCTFVSGAATLSYEGSIYVPNAVRATFTNCIVANSAGHGAWVGGASTTDVTFAGCTFIDNGTTGNDHRGVTVDSSCNRITFTGCTFNDNTEAGLFATATVGGLVVNGCMSKGNNTDFRAGGHGYEILAPGATLTGCTAIGTLGNAANEGCGFYFGPKVVATGCVADSNYSAGFRAFDADSTSMVGCVARNNSQRTVGGHPGFDLNATTAAVNVSLVGCRAFDDQGTKTQSYGATVTATIDYYTVVGCNFQGNATGTLSDSGGANKAVANNL